MDAARFFEMLFEFLIPENGADMCYDPTSASSIFPLYIDIGYDPSQTLE